MSGNDEVRDDAGFVLSGPFKHIRVLERRMRYLEQRIQRGIREGKNLTHDQHEVDAIKWAIDSIYQWVDLPEREE